ncbi:response regulator [Thermodesulfobacteriota bacterium]
MSKKALIVDKDIFFVEFFSGILEARGYEVSRAYDGKEGVAKLQEGPVDLLVVDMVMPKIDGSLLIKFARAKYPNEPFLTITAVSGTLVEQAGELEAIGADYYIAKGPRKQMGNYLQSWLDTIEDRVPSESERCDILTPERVYPRRTTMELIERLTFSRSIIENLPVGVIVVDRDGRVINMNTKAEEITNKSIAEVLNQHATCAFEKYDRDAVVESLKEVVTDVDVPRASFWATLGSIQVRVLVSLLKINGDIAGWILCLDNMQVNEED